jgi:hypothetical protein
MRETFKTADLFSAILPPFPASFTSAVRFHFADVADQASGISTDRPANDWRQGSTWNDDAWSGTQTMRDALTLAHDGWKEGAEQAQKLRDGINAARPHAPKLARYDVAGAVPNVARALAGNPMNMRRLAMRESARMPTLTLVCDIWNNAGCTSEAMLAQAASVAAIADLLEEAGYRCEILAVGRAQEGALAFEVATRVKAAEQPMNLSAVVFGIGHTAMLRRLAFAIADTTQEASPLKSWLGRALPCTSTPELGTFTTPSAQQTEGTALQRFVAICRALRAQGCPGIPDDDQLPTA